MNTYNIIWANSGNAIYRNAVYEDPRPTVVQAAYFENLTGPDGQVGGLKFYNTMDENPFLVIYDIPLMVSRAGA